jgi:hypothetical protein
MDDAHVLHTDNKKHHQKENVVLHFNDPHYTVAKDANTRPTPTDAEAHQIEHNRCLA